MRKVYVGMTANILHPGHINIINIAGQLGEVTVGLLTDEVISRLGRPPLLSFNERKHIIENIKGVKEVIPQDDMDYSTNLLRLKPDIVVHGDDWKVGPAKVIRQKVIDLLKNWGGQLVEPATTKEYSGSFLANELRRMGTTPELRMKSLKRLLEIKDIVRLIEVHSGLTGLIAEKTKVVKDDQILEFDGMWESSLTDSASKGKPDNAAVDFSSRQQTIEQILEVTTKPIVVDADNGGLIEHFVFTVRNLERLGVSAVIIEDKVGQKRNSLFGTDVDQEQDSIEDFCQKISTGKKAQVTQDFMIIARIESLILKKGLDDALKRAQAYIDAGADGIMIHSKEETPDEVFEFCKHFNKFTRRVPLVAVPTTYGQVTETELCQMGVNIVIYANHMLRSAIPAMTKTAELILAHGRSHEAHEYCLPVKEMINFIPPTI